MSGLQTGIRPHSITLAWATFAATADLHRPQQRPESRIYQVVLGQRPSDVMAPVSSQVALVSWKENRTDEAWGLRETDQCNSHLPENKAARGMDIPPPTERNLSWSFQSNSSKSSKYFSLYLQVLSALPAFNTPQCLDHRSASFIHQLQGPQTQGSPSKPVFLPSSWGNLCAYKQVTTASWW